MITAGTIRTVVSEYVRHECENCGEPATKKHTFLLPNARRNAASAAYGRDDIRYCQDGEAFTCDDCRQPSLDGMEWCATWLFSLPQNTHHFHYFREISRTDHFQEAAQ